jgi:hypothetical protein
LNISEHFTLAELTKTLDGIENEASVEAGANLVRLAEEALEPARTLAGGPLHVSEGGGFRSAKLNVRTKGARTSAHLDGRAADLTPATISAAVFFDLVRFSAIPYDQVILETRGTVRWVHLAIARLGEKPRRQALLGTVDPVTRKARYEVAK